MPTSKASALDISIPMHINWFGQLTSYIGPIHLFLMKDSFEKKKSFFRIINRKK